MAIRGPNRRPYGEYMGTDDPYDAYNDARLGGTYEPPSLGRTYRSELADVETWTQKLMRIQRQKDEEGEGGD
jgi:hypothetical protein